MAADDSQNPPPDQGVPLDLDASSPISGNRPASGARRATPGEVLSQGFQGAQNAGDFLGLDTEFTASQDPSQAYGAGTPLDLVSPPGTYSLDAAQAGYAPPIEPAPLPPSDPVQDFAQAPSAFEFGEDLGSEEGEVPLAEEGAPSRRPLFASAILVAVLTAGGVFYGPGLYARFFGSDTHVARGPENAAPQPKPPRAATASEPEPATSTPDAKPDQVEPVPGPKVSVPAPAAEGQGRTGERPGSTPTRAPERGAKIGLEPRPSAAVQPSDVGASLPAPSAPGQGATERPRPTSFPDLAGSAYEWASEDLLELIWRGSEVPLEAVSAPAKTLMPRVGNVRVFNATGDVFEGRLYAVGQNRVWLDVRPGQRIGLDGERVARIEVLPPLPEGQQASAGELQLAGGKRVRVRVPGGMLYGRVLKAEGEEVTLALDDGGRVRVKAHDIQDLGSGRAVVVGR